MAIEQPATLPYGRLSALCVSVVLMTTALTWVFLSMRAVMDIGGTCASGGPYEIARPCPDNVAVFMTLGVPVMMVSAFAGTAVAVGLAAPDLILPMWWALFGSLGWNFLDYGFFHGDVVWGWAFCGIVFELMALPALLFQLPWGHDGPPQLNPHPPARTRWLLGYAVLAVAGVSLGWWTYTSWS